MGVCQGAASSGSRATKLDTLVTFLPLVIRRWIASIAAFFVFNVAGLQCPIDKAQHGCGDEEVEDLVHDGIIADKT